MLPPRRRQAHRPHGESRLLTPLQILGQAARGEEPVRRSRCHAFDKGRRRLRTAITPTHRERSVSDPEHSGHYEGNMSPRPRFCTCDKAQAMAASPRCLIASSGTSTNATHKHPTPHHPRPPQKPARPRPRRSRATRIRLQHESPSTCPRRRGAPRPRDEESVLRRALVERAAGQPVRHRLVQTPITRPRAAEQQ